jgi:hypothetical protein
MFDEFAEKVITVKKVEGRKTSLRNIRKNKK